MSEDIQENLNRIKATADRIEKHLTDVGEKQSEHAEIALRSAQARLAATSQTLDRIEQTLLQYVRPVAQRRRQQTGPQETKHAD